MHWPFSWNNILSNVWIGLLTELVVVVAGVVIAKLLELTWIRWRYGGWTVHILKDGKEILAEEIPAVKARDLLADPISLRIYLKGLVSAYGWLRVDLLNKGREEGWFQQNKTKRRFIIDLDRAPLESGKHPSPELEAVEKAT